MRAGLVEPVGLGEPSAASRRPGLEMQRFGMVRMLGVSAILGVALAFVAYLAARVPIVAAALPAASAPRAWRVALLSSLSVILVSLMIALLACSRPGGRT